MHLSMHIMLPKNDDECVQVKLYMKTATDSEKKYLCRDRHCKFSVQDYPDELSWTLQKKTVLYVESYDPECRNVYLRDTYILYYIYSGKYHYFHITYDFEKNVYDYKITQGTQNYNRYTLGITKEGQIKFNNTDISLFVEI